MWVHMGPCGPSKTHGGMAICMGVPMGSSIRGSLNTHVNAAAGARKSRRPNARLLTPRSLGTDISKGCRAAAGISPVRVGCLPSTADEMTQTSLTCGPKQWPGHSRGPNVSAVATREYRIMSSSASVTMGVLPRGVTCNVGPSGGYGLGGVLRGKGGEGTRRRGGADPRAGVRGAPLGGFEARLGRREGVLAQAARRAVLRRRQGMLARCPGSAGLRRREGMLAQTAGSAALRRREGMLAQAGGRAGLRRREGMCTQAAGSAGPGAPAAGTPGGVLAGLWEAIQAGLAEAGGQGPRSGSSLEVMGVTFQPPGAEAPLLRDVSLALGSNEVGLVYGRSGAGKTTLLQLLAGLQAPSAGTILLKTSGTGPPLMTESHRMAHVGLVFQFPERHFLGTTIGSELTFAWTPEDAAAEAALGQTSRAMAALGLDVLGADAPLSALSDGYKRRVALAVQVARRPSLLLLDEPLAGLDWRARAEIVSLLGRLRKECTVLVVSHDLAELAPLVDRAWQMLPGGQLHPADWSAGVPDLSDLD